MSLIEKLYRAVIPSKLRLMIRLYCIHREIAREKINRTLGGRKPQGVISRALRHHFFPETRLRK
ncbi:hypothetical protein K9N08_04595 [Candidatus Gracilibacteria bacterium]|nr:hypothetical protein [Candidatus Gracilibacteria bacterium]